MNIAVIGARGSAGMVCVQELAARNIDAMPLGREDSIPSEVDAIIVAAEVKQCIFEGPLVDCSGSIPSTSLSLPPILKTTASRKRVPNCMASLIAQALAPLHQQCIITSIIATTMQSVSGAGWRGVQALEQNDTTNLFGGDLVNNVLPHENFIQEEHAIKNDLHELFGCKVTATSFRVPVFVGHVASVRITTDQPIVPIILPEAKHFDPRTMEHKRDVAIGRVRIHKNTADLVVCGDQLLCGTAIPAIDSILGT